jgi:tetratricopeptide (TPR) repeat protein
LALADLAAEVEAAGAELARFREFQEFIERAREVETAGTEPPVAAGGSHSRAETSPRATLAGRRPAAAVPFLLQALQRYQILERDDWNTILEGGFLGKQQVEQIRRAAYAELLWLADDLGHRFEEHQSGQKLSREAAARQALIYLRKAESVHRPTHAFYAVRAGCQAALGEEAAADADRQLRDKTPPAMAVDHYLRGQAAYAHKQLADGVRSFEAALRLEPTHYWSMMGLGYCLCDLGRGPEDFAAAAAIFRGCIMSRPDHAHAYIWRANAYTKLRRYEQALTDYSQAIGLDAKQAYVWNQRGSAYFYLGQPKRANADYTKAIELDSKDATAWGNRALTYSELGQPDKAIADCNKAIKLNPKFAPAWRNRGRAYGELRQYDKALADLNRAIDLDPKDVFAWVNRGLAYSKSHQYAKGLANSNKAIELDRKFAPAWYNRGCTYNELYQYDKALADWNKAIELDRRLGPAWNSLAWLFATCPQPKFRDAGKAVGLAKKAVELAPKEANYWNTLGAAHYRAGNWKEAVAALEKSMKLGNGGHSLDWFFLAMAHWQQREKEKARSWFDQAVQWMDKNQPNNEELRRFRAEAAELLGIKEH